MRTPDEHHYYPADVCVRGEPISIEEHYWIAHSVPYEVMLAYGLHGNAALSLIEKVKKAIWYWDGKLY